MLYKISNRSRYKQCFRRHK